MILEATTKNMIYYGSKTKLPATSEVRAGKLTMIYETGNLRTIKLGKLEIVRMIYSAVRDGKWLTAEPVISNEHIQCESHQFHIEYDCRYQLNDIDFNAHYRIKGSADNSLLFEMEGEALSDFSKNRIGFCILHPIEGCAGLPCKITTPDGQIIESEFPVGISPHQPFKNIKAMQWPITKESFARLQFSGDIFETEDHRNWTDASFKTYCTPLDLPYPVFIEKGTKIYQKIELSVLGETAETDGKSEIINFELSDTRISFPKIGIGQSSRPQSIAKDESYIIRNIGFSHYRTDIYLKSTSWKKALILALNEAQQLNLPLEIALFFSEDPDHQATEFIFIINQYQPVISSILIFHDEIRATPNELAQSVIPILRTMNTPVSIGVGTNANFAQLNRSRPDSGSFDFISYAIHPQEHAFDNQTLVENLHAQKYTVESAANFSHGKPIHVSPVTIQRRFNANIENYENPVPEGVFPPQIDYRQPSLFGASWTTGSLKYLAEAGCRSITWFETVGERGIIQGNIASRYADKFHSYEKMIFPLYHVFRFLLHESNLMVIPCKSSNPLAVDALICEKGSSRKIILVNYTPTNQLISGSWIQGNAQIYRLNEFSFEKATTDPNWFTSETPTKWTFQPEMPIRLAPFETMFIDVTTS